MSDTKNSTNAELIERLASAREFALAALAALSQNKTFPADVKFARQCMADAAKVADVEE